MTPAEHEPPPRPVKAPKERWQHGVEREVNSLGREAVSRPIKALRASRRIGDAEVVAAERFYEAYFFGIAGARDGEGGSSGTPSPDGMMVARMDAALDYSTATKALDATDTRLLHALVLQERSLSSLAGKPGGKAVTRIANAAAKALKALADHYARRDCSVRGYKSA